MRIAINGAGVAGPTLAWWLRHYGHEPVLYEKAPSLRTGGYIIDFWGVGYDVAERMGILPALIEAGYMIRELRMLGRHGRTEARLGMDTFARLLAGRYLSVARGDLAAIVYRSCRDVPAVFGVSIVGVDGRDRNVRVRLSDGSEDEFDLVVGADGLHSQIRSVVFGPKAQFERPLGCCVAAFAVQGYRPRDELTYVSYTSPKRQVFRIAFRNDVTSFLFVFREELLGEVPASLDERRHALRAVFRDMGWELPQIMARLEEVDDIYFDRVSQIRLDEWSKGPVALIGDAAACVSLLAGEGTGLAMAEAYVLAGELHRAAGDHTRAYREYETKLRPFLHAKQQAALGMIGFFAPKSAWGIYVRNVMISLAARPLLAKLFLNASLRDDFRLPEYTS